MTSSKLIKPNILEYLEVLFEIIKLDRAEQRQDGRNKQRSQMGAPRRDLRGTMRQGLGVGKDTN